MVAGLLSFAVLGLVLLPPVARAVVAKQLSKHLARAVSIRNVRLNPCTLSATIEGLSIKEQDGSPLMSCEQAYVNLQLVTFFSHAWVFKEIRLLRPALHVEVNKDYRLNFSDIVERFSRVAARKPGEAATLHPWKIHQLYLTGGTVSLADLTPQTPFHKTVGPFEMTVNNFQSASGHKNAFAVSGVSDAGEQFSCKGWLCLSPLRSEGEVSIDGFALTTYAPLYQDFFRFTIQDGVIGLHSSYRYESSAVANLLVVTNATFELRSLRVVENGTGQAVGEARTITVTGASVDAMARSAEVDTMSITGGRFALRRNRDTSVNAIELLTPAEATPAAPGGILLLLRGMTNLVAAFLSTTNVANGTIRDLHLTNCALHLEDLVNSEPVRLDLEDIAAHGRNISNRGGTNMTAEVSLRWDTNGTVRADIKAASSPPNAEVQLAFDKLDLRPLAPYLEPHLNIFVLGSKLGLVGTVRLLSTAKELPEVRFQGDTWLEGFSTAEGTATEGLLRWNSLRLSGIEANLNPPVVYVKEVRLGDVFARLIIETNRTINLLTALRLGGTNAAAVPQLTNVATAGRPKVSLASVVLSNANVHFIDRSLQPNVNIRLEQLSGILSGLSSDDPDRGEVHLQGTVDQTARAEITGSINPWNSKQPMDLRLSLKEMDLLAGDPYSGKYLGYRLKKGTLSAQLTYQVIERQLKSENRLMLDQLTLGQKVESPDATGLPVRLAIALLKDRDGRIWLDFPVDGSLDDPQFSLGEIAYDALKTALTRIVTSPFTALAALFGGQGEELSFQEFQPGSTNLLPAATFKLELLANALFERPELQLEIEGGADPLTDLEALRRAELNKQLLGQERNMPLSPAETNAAATEVPPRRRYRRAFPVEKGSAALRSPVAHSATIPIESTWTENYLAPGSATAIAGDKGATALMLAFAPAGPAADADWDRELLENVGIVSDALSTLAVERARNVRAYLIQTGKVAPERITESAGGPGSKGSRVSMRLH
jgi:hypothetical protein